MNTTTIVKWGHSHLKASIIATLASENALRIALRKKVLNENIADDSMKTMTVQVQSTLEATERTIKGKNLAVILVVFNKNTNKEEKIRSTYDSLHKDRDKLMETGRELQAWFPANFASFSEWMDYAESVKQELRVLVKEKVLA